MNPTKRTLLTCFVCFGFLAARVSAEEPERQVYERYRRTIQALGEDLKAAEARYEAEFVGKVNDPQNRPLPREKVLEELSYKQKNVATALLELDLAREKLRDRSPNMSLAAFFERAQELAELAARSASDANVDEAKWRVLRIRQELSRKTDANQDEFNDKCRALGASMKISSDEFKAAERKERAEAAGREQPMLDEAVKAHAAAAKAFVERRRVLAGELWRLVDFHERREQDAEAKFFRTLVYRIHCYLLHASGVEKNYSDLDRFVDFPGSPDRIVATGYFASTGKDVYKFDEALAAEPVESLRKFDDKLPPLEFEGPETEQLARILSARLLRFYKLRAQDESLFRRLAELNAILEPLPATFPDLRPLDEALKSFPKTMLSEENESEDRKRAEKAVADAEEWAEKKRKELGAREKTVFVDAADRVVEKKGKDSKPASGRMAELDRQIAAEDGLAADATLSKEEQDAHRRIAGKARDKRAALEGAVKKACAAEQAASDTAVADLERARKDLAALPPGGASVVAEKWQKISRLYADAAGELPAASREGVPDLPAKADEKALETALKGAELLAARVAELKSRRAAAIRELRESYGELRRVEIELGLLTQHITGLRHAAAVTADKALSDLGARPDDDAVVAAQELMKRLEKAKDYVSKADMPFEALGKLDHLKELADLAHEPLKIVSGTLKYIGLSAETALALKETADALGDDRRALSAISKLLKLSANAGEFIPVLGPTFGRFLTFYADAAGTCGTAIVSLQDKLIKENVRVLFSQPPPERHLWLESEITATATLENDDARKRIRLLLQARRLVYLAGAKNEADARDMTR